MNVQNGIPPQEPASFRGERRYTLEELEALARKFAQTVTPPTTLLLWGDLGAGKTTFARTFLRTYFRDETLEVPSPTFTLVQTYSGQKERSEVWHVDLYRLKSEAEIYELGLEEALYQHICLVEWPEAIASWPLMNRIDVHLMKEREE